MRYTLYLNGENISSCVRSVKSSIKFKENRFIGNAPSEEFKIELDNTSSYFNRDKLKGVFTLYKGDTLYKTLKVYEQPEKLFKDLSLTLYDSMVETNIRYDTDISTYPKTIRDQLNEMGEIIKKDIDTILDRFVLGVSILGTTQLSSESTQSTSYKVSRSDTVIDYSLLPEEILDREVDFYDNTQLIRTYLRWIAELGCCNVFSRSDGKIKFIPLTSETQFELTEDKYVYEFETEEKYSCSGVFMEYLDLFEGTKDNHVYRLIKDNPYITTIEHVQNIFSKIQGLTFTSVKNLKTRYVDSLFLGNKANYKDYFSFIPFEMEVVYHAGDLSHDTCTISGRYSTEAEEEYINTPTLKDRVRRVEINVDQNKQSLQIISQDVDENKENISLLQIDSESVSGRVSSIEYGTDDLDDQLKDFKKTYETYTEQTSKKFVDVVKESKEYTDGELQDIKDVFVYFEKTTEGLVVRKESDNPDDLLVSTLVAPDSFQVRFNGVATTSIFQEGIDTSSLWLSKSLHLNPLSFTGYGSGEKGGVVIKWRGFD